MTHRMTKKPADTDRQTDGGHTGQGQETVRAVGWGGPGKAALSSVLVQRSPCCPRGSLQASSQDGLEGAPPRSPSSSPRAG